MASHVFEQILKLTLKLVFNSLILIEMSHCDLKGWCKGA